MFGNTLGWIISVVIAALAAYLGHELLMLARPTSPTGWVEATVKPLDLTDAAQAALEPMNGLKDDAGDLYRQAIVDYEQNKISYENAQKAQNLEDANLGALRGLGLLIQAAHCASMDLFKSHPQEVVGYESNVDALDELEEIAKTAEYLVALAKLEKNYTQARAYANAVAALGYHLYQERIALVELNAAENFMGTGIAALQQIAKAEQADDKIAALDKLQNVRMDEYTSRISPVMEVMTSQSQQSIGLHAGDMYQLALDPHADRMWRVEAIRRIARLHYNAENSADQIKSPVFLSSLANDQAQDAVIRAAAAKARDMTPYENQGQR